jgi:hypothetical protein
MRADVKAALQERWENSLRERARLSPRSIVPVLDVLLGSPEPTRRPGIELAVPQTAGPLHCKRPRIDRT